MNFDEIFFNLVYLVLYALSDLWPILAALLVFFSVVFALVAGVQSMRR